MKSYKINTEALEDVLLGMGHRENLLGTQYLREAVPLYASGYARMTKELYPELGRMFGTTASRVERDIRNSIESAIAITDPDFIRETFGNTIDPSKGKPTNGAYIARLARICRED